MKKLICAILAFVIVLSFCACGQTPAEPVETTEPSVPETTEVLDGGYKYDTEVSEATKPDCSNINEFEPNEDGVYQIHTPEGLMNMINHPDGSFELLWHIDMGGVKWTPVGSKAEPFTGSIEGGYFTVSNFVIDTPNADGDMGFFGTFAGDVKELNLADVTITTTADTQRAGLWCAHNDDGKFLRCDNSNSMMTVAEAAENAAIGAIVGVNEGSFRNGTMDVSLTVTASGNADVGGIAGYASDGKIQFIKNEGFIEVTGSNKNVGLFAGSVEEDAEIKGCVFLGEKNTIDGIRFEDYVGIGNRKNVLDCLYRDNNKPAMDPVIQQKRDIAEAAMRAMGTISWTVPEDMHYSCTCAIPSCAGIHKAGYEIRGIQYNHKCGSLARLEYVLDENNVLHEWAMTGEYDGFDCYIGNDCSTSLLQAYWHVSADLDFDSTNYQLPAQNMGTVPVGDWEWDLGYIPTYNDAYIEATGEQRMYEAYACLRKADFIVGRFEEGGHTRMIAEDAIVIRNEDGLIDGMESYLVIHEQGAERTLEPYFSSWNIDYRISFSGIYLDWYVPATIEEFVTGEFEEPMAELRGGLNGKLGLTTGTVYSNFFLDSVEMIIVDSDGQEVFNKRMFTTVSKLYDDSNHLDLVIRQNNHEYDLGHFAVPLQKVMFEPGESYHCTVTAYVGSGDSFVVKEFNFTNGIA